MKTPKVPRQKKIRRNPHARALGSALYRQKVEKGKDEYRRKRKHPKPTDEENGSSIPFLFCALDAESG